MHIQHEQETFISTDSHFLDFVHQYWNGWLLSVQEEAWGFSVYPRYHDGQHGSLCHLLHLQQDVLQVQKYWKETIWRPEDCHLLIWSCFSPFHGWSCNFLHLWIKNFCWNSGRVKKFECQLLLSYFWQSWHVAFSICCWSLLPLHVHPHFGRFQHGAAKEQNTSLLGGEIDKGYRFIFVG